ncbi:MAG: hypothetical protein FWD72_06710, partial [Eggerthellaceae bacterium]|nr:hypothetical protein [Eggerthellaceae bacterium]
MKKNVASGTPNKESSEKTGKRRRATARFALSAFIAATIVTIALAAMFASAAEGDGTGGLGDLGGTGGSGIVGMSGIAPLDAGGTSLDGQSPDATGSALDGQGGGNVGAPDGTGDLSDPYGGQFAPQGDPGLGSLGSPDGGTFGAPMGIEPLTTTIAGVGTINASVTNADNGVVAFDGSDGNSSTVQMGYSQIFNHVSNIYIVKVDLVGMPSDQTNTLTVTLPLGMAFQYTTTASYLAQAGQFANDVASSSYTRGTSPIAGNSFSNGTFTFTLKSGVAATTAYVPVMFDNAVNTDTITNAVKVTLTNGSGSVSETLAKVTRETDTGTVANAPLTTNAFFFSDGSTITPASDRKNFRIQASGNQLTCLFTSFTVNLHISDPRAQLINTDTTGQWAMDSSDATNGNYSFTMTPTGGIGFAQFIEIPYSVVFPDTAGWAAGDVVTMVYTAGTQVTYAQFDVG